MIVKIGTTEFIIPDKYHKLVRQLLWELCSGAENEGK